MQLFTQNKKVIIIYVCRRRREFIIYETRAGISQGGGACSHKNYISTIRKFFWCVQFSACNDPSRPLITENSMSRACFASHATVYFLLGNVLFQSSLKCVLMDFVRRFFCAHLFSHKALIQVRKTIMIKCIVILYTFLECS